MVSERRVMREEVLGIPSTFTCHCTGGVIGFVAGILLVRIIVF